jgi:hypothetical protein
MNECTNEWIECMNQWIKEWKNKELNEWKKDWMKVNGRYTGWMMNKWMKNKSMNEIYEFIIKLRKDWINELLNRKMK